jgi:peptidoglycan/LPS O-acetylase OafA/YrhL
VATILLYLAMERFFPAPPLNWHYAFFLQNYTGAVGFGPSWTLCVEEHFYLFLPVILAPAVYFGGVRVLRWLLPVLCFTPLLLRFGWYFTAGMPNKWFRFSHFHADGLIAGVWLAYLFVEQPELFARLRRPAKWLLPLVPIMIFFIPQWEPHPVFADLFLCGAWALGYLPWLVYAYGIEWHPATKAGRLLHWAITGTALCSYSVYLTHTIFDPAIRSGILGSWHRSVGKSLIVLTFTFLGGVIFYFLVERPSIVTRDRYLKARTETPVPVTAAVS